MKYKCLTVDGWAEAKLEAYSKQLIADAKMTAKRNKGETERQEAVSTSNETSVFEV